MIVILSSIGILGYLGFLPGVSALFGSNKPRDLGVKYTIADHDNYVQKAGTQLNYSSKPPAPNKSFTASGEKGVKASFSPEEITGRVNLACLMDLSINL